MLEQESASGISMKPDHESFGTQPIGEYLRRQRVLRGMSAEELAQLTRIPLRSLERLENGQFDGETDGFVRGFVRTVADALGLDVEDAVSRMLAEPVSGVWERHHAGRSLKQGLVGAVFVVILVLLFLGMRAVWNVSFGEGGAPSAREVVVWRDPVHALAEATGSTESGMGSGAQAERRDSVSRGLAEASATADP